MVPKLGWIRTKNLLNHGFLISRFSDPQEPSTQSLGSTSNSPKAFNYDQCNMDGAAKARVAKEKKVRRDVEEFQGLVLGVS